MNRYHKRKGKGYGEGEDMMQQNKYDEFLEEYENLCRKFNITISHEDTQGRFILEPFDSEDIEWMRGAYRE